MSTYQTARGVLPTQAKRQPADIYDCSLPRVRNAQKGPRAAGTDKAAAEPEAKRAVWKNLLG